MSYQIIETKLQDGEFTVRPIVIKTTWMGIRRAFLKLMESGGYVFIRQHQNLFGGYAADANGDTLHIV